MTTAKLFLLFILPLAISTSSFARDALMRKESWKNLRLEDSSPTAKGELYFTLGTPSLITLKTGLFDLQVLGTLSSSDSDAPPYFILKAKACEDCFEEFQLFAIRADGKARHSFIFPGKIELRDSQEVSFEGRGFFGDCLEKGPALVLFQKERLPRRTQLQESVFIGILNQKNLFSEELRQKNLPSLRSITQRVHSGTCQEITGYDRTTAPRSVVQPENLHRKN
jgi:hypothetical protein